MLRISFFTSFDHPQGTYFRWHNLAIGLQQLGHEVTVYSVGERRFGGSRAEVRDGIRYRVTPVTPGINRLFDWRLDPFAALRLAWRVPPADVYHIFQPFPHSCFPGGLHRQKAATLIYDWDDLWMGGVFAPDNRVFHRGAWLSRVVGWLERRMPKLANGVTTCSGYLADAAKRNGASSVKVVHNGYWPTESSISKIAARERFGLDPDAFYFGYMGRTHQELPWCLDALATPHPASKRVRLALCGMTESAINKLPAEYPSHIDYLGNLTPEATQVFARALDCGLLPLENSTFNQSRFPIKFAEYLAAGAHVVTSAIGEIAALSQELPGVTLAGETRDSWQEVFRSGNLETFTAEFSSSPGSVLAQKLSWSVLARQLEVYYFARMHRDDQDVSFQSSGGTGDSSGQIRRPTEVASTP